MTTEPTPLPHYDEDTEFKVTLLQLVKVGAMKLYPINEHTMTGAFLNRIIAENGVGVVSDVHSAA